MAQRFEVALPQEYLELLPDESEPFDMERALGAFEAFVDSLRGLGLAGLHLFVLADTKLSAKALQRLCRESFRQRF